MKISILSDTHGYLDDQIIKYLQTTDEVWHAGDIGDIEVYDRLNKLKGELRIVFGNIDSSALRNLTKEYIYFELQGVKILIIHIAGSPPKYNKAVKSLINRYHPDILVAGHSHILKVLNDKENNILFINPGACGRHGFHIMRTIIQFEINNGKPENLKVIELGKRGQVK